MPTSQFLRRLLVLLFCLAAWPAARADDKPALREWTIDGVVRQALIYALPRAKTNDSPVIFAFHGHGGNMNLAARSFDFQTKWPEAIVVYMQGLHAPGNLVDPDGKLNGWQRTVDDLGGRDLKFFDTVLATLHQEYRVDDKRIYATGHSHGGFFTYLLWAARGDKLAAVAPVAAFAGPAVLAQLKPKPVLHVAGENDPLVKFERQQQTMDALRKLNGCSEGQPWENVKWCTLYPSKLGTPVVTYIHPGQHGFPDGASSTIVTFFKEHALP